MYIPCVDEEAQLLLDEYKKSGDPDIANHLIESLDAVRRARLLLFHACCSCCRFQLYDCVIIRFVE